MRWSVVGKTTTLAKLAARCVAREPTGRHADDGQFPDRRAGAVADLRPPPGRAHAFGARRRRAASPAGRAGQPQDRADRHHRHQPARSPRGRAGRDAVRRRQDLRPPHGRAHAFGARRRRAASPAGRAGQPQDRADRHHRHQPARSPRGRAGRDAVRRRQDGAPPAGAQRRQPGRHAGRGGARLPQWRGRDVAGCIITKLDEARAWARRWTRPSATVCRSITCRSARRCPSTWSWRAPTR